MRQSLTTQPKTSTSVAARTKRGYVWGGGASRSGKLGEWITFNNKAQTTVGVTKIKPLDAWEKLAQVLMVSNEFFFVD